MTSIVVASRTFSNHLFLKDELKKKYKNIIFNENNLKLEGSSLVNFLKGHDKAITSLEKIDENTLQQLPDLKVISKYGVGLDMIDLKAMKKFNKKLSWTPGTNKRSVSELALSFAINLLHRIPLANSEVKKGNWDQIIGKQLSSKIFGIIGCGNIGKDLINLLKPFNCKIIVNDIKNYKDFYLENNIKVMEIEDLLKNSDVVSLHVPLNPSTRNILNAKRIGLMKQNSYVINLARGGLIDEDALKKSLISGHISGAAMDVLNFEPPNDNALYSMDNVLVTPHIGGSTEESIIAMGLSAIEGLNNAKDPMEFIGF